MSAAGPYDHIDLRVREVAPLRPFYDALMFALGLQTVVAPEGERSYYSNRRDQPFFGLTEDPGHVPNSSRVAFGAATRDDVDRVAWAVRRAGAHKLEGPEVCTDYRQPYYAAFFEDAEGNRFEVCCRH
ncbi:MAG: glyoxalase [Candidatus Eremiobacter antarcticus]|nr:glyoxalase [Candidatus Eremiobacteraeota bacterium]MBC5808208.1 glyoxalase [Candidatus Eremiobacteraeota bacterium]PZR63598.1 MAG: glyoxalase [Candidatus Eremiobacter sp. RRmetagenome_bin22]